MCTRRSLTRGKKLGVLAIGLILLPTGFHSANLNATDSDLNSPAPDSGSFVENRSLEDERSIVAAKQDKTQTSPVSKQEKQTTPKLQSASSVTEKPERPQDVAKTLAQAINYLQTSQKPDGSWKESGIGGESALNTLALIRCSDLSDAGKRELAIQSLATKNFDLTYSVALQTIVLCESGNKDYANKIQSNVKWLTDSQVPNGGIAGGWTYRRPEENNFRADGSNTRFAVWALTIARRHGFDVPQENLQLAAKYWIASQLDNGGWSYMFADKRELATMTLSGIACLAMLEPTIEANPALAKSINDAIVRGWQTPNLEAGIKANKNWPIYGWQVYVLATESTDPNTKGLNKEQFADPIRLFKSLKSRQNAIGRFNAKMGSNAIPTSLAIIALTEGTGVK